ncbi:glycoside hydrolase family 16 protein [Marasmius fiardii PR-910]|nr:glycoside hydrolase family 16 protein [Marasmius fiardii PR-910]
MRTAPLFLLSVATTLNAGRVSIPSTLQSRASYTLQDNYQGEDFFTKFDFFSDADPTQGLVDYQTKDNAISKGLAFVQNGVTVLAVDNQTTIATGSKRASVRIESQQLYGKGLFIADFEAMPFGCSTWPAWWSYSFNEYPQGGEIDVIEGVHNQPYNDLTFWRAGGSCNFPPDSLSGAKAGVIDQAKCSDTTSEQQSCGFQDESAGVFGSGFNQVGGGVYAHLVNDEGIFVWHFARSSIPSDITNKNPNPSSWGTPVAQWKSNSCDIAQHVKGHKLTINITLCGSWAGDPDVWRGSGCPGTCEGTVANPKNFDNARWKIRSISVYQEA